MKAISDVADFDLPPMDRFVKPDGSFSEMRFAWFAAIRPWVWPQVLRLAANAGGHRTRYARSWKRSSPEVCRIECRKPEARVLSRIMP